VSRLGEDTYRWTAADPSLRWFRQNATGMRVVIDDISEQVAALALQGPTSARVLRNAAEADIDSLRYFRVTSGTIAGVPVDISRTGYTGDLGYEIWIPAESALTVWDALMHAGRPFDIKPAGMLALDVARVEAGLLLIDVDFNGSKKALIGSQKYTPFEMGLGRLVQLDKAPFVGRRALIEEQRRGSKRMIVGLEAPAAASRVAVPVMRDGRQVGKATTTAWSPTLKRLIALATIDAPHFAPGTQVEVEITVEAQRQLAGATVVPTPFFNPPRKTATPPQ
jgi:aminomethyltransferase